MTETIRPTQRFQNIPGTPIRSVRPRLKPKNAPDFCILKHFPTVPKSTICFSVYLGQAIYTCFNEGVLDVWWSFRQEQLHFDSEKEQAIRKHHVLIWWIIRKLPAANRSCQHSKSNRCIFVIISDKTQHLMNFNNYRRQHLWLRTYYESIKLFDQQIWLF